MLLFEPDRTPYDWHFRLFGVPVRVHPMFWLIGAILGFDTVNLGFEYLLIWMVCLFFSILIHELGHVWMGQVFGSEGYIVIYGFGGLAVGSNQLPNPWRRIAVSLAGPVAGFLLLAALLFGLRLGDPGRFYFHLEWMKLSLLGLPMDWEGIPVFQPNPHLDWAIMFLVWINLIWGLVNLLPIWPLDGGQISRDLFRMASPANGLRISLGISFVVAAILALHCILAANGRPLFPFLPIGSGYTALFFALFAIQSFMLLQQAQARRRDWDDWDRDPEIWGR